MKIKMTKQQFEDLLSMCDGHLPEPRSQRGKELTKALEDAILAAKTKKAERQAENDRAGAATGSKA